MKEDDFVKSPSAALRFNFAVPDRRRSLVRRPHSSVFARLASGAFYEVIPSQTFYESIKEGSSGKNEGKGDSDAHCHIG